MCRFWHGPQGVGEKSHGWLVVVSAIMLFNCTTAEGNGNTMAACKTYIVFPTLPSKFLLAPLICALAPPSVGEDRLERELFVEKDLTTVWKLHMS